MSAATATAGERGIAPRPVFCVIGHAYRDRGVADDACRGTFTFAGETVDLGPTPDWVGAALPADREWRIEWTKFYFGLDLAHAFHETGDARYLEAWQRLVAGYLRQVAPGEGVEDTVDVAARRVQNWVYAWAAFAAAPAFAGLRAGFDRELLDGIGEHGGVHPGEPHAERNHRTLELYALLIVALALPELDRDGGLLAFAMAELHANLHRPTSAPDGVHREQSTHYHCIVLRSFLGARENARRFGLAFPDGYDEHLARACEFAMHCHRPDGTIAALGDSDSGALRATCSSSPPTSSTARTCAGPRPPARPARPPTRRYVSFATGGYHVQRSGWGDRGRAVRRRALADLRLRPARRRRPRPLRPAQRRDRRRRAPARPRPGPLHLRRAGARTSATGSRARRRTTRSSSTASTRRRTGAASRARARSPAGACVERHSAPGLDIVVGEADEHRLRRRPHAPGRVRRDEYWVDRGPPRRGRTPHRYDLRFHLAPDAEGRVAVERRDGVVGRARAGRSRSSSSATPRRSIEPGWTSPDYGIRHAAPVVSIVADGAADATFTTLVLPLPDGAAVPDVALRSCEEATALEVTGERFADTICWSRGGFPLDLGPLRCRATAGWMRRGAEGPVRVRAAGVGGGPVWAGWDEGRGMSAGREGDL